MALLAIDKLTDAQLRDVLLKLDCNDEVDVTTCEADWLERTIYRHKGPVGPAKGRSGKVVEEVSAVAVKNRKIYAEFLRFPLAPVEYLYTIRTWKQQLTRERVRR